MTLSNIVRIAFFACLALTTGAALPACTIKQVATPVAKDVLATKPLAIVLVQNTAVRMSGFHGELERALTRRGFAVETKPMGADLSQFPLAMTYTANWSWDMDLYMSYAQLDVFRKGVKAGDAVYDSRGGSFHAAKFIDADRKVDELVGEVFPGLAPPLPKPEALQ
jgi:hypothetical protein